MKAVYVFYLSDFGEPNEITAPEVPEEPEVPAVPTPPTELLEDLKEIEGLELTDDLREALKEGG